jgi:14-3-3 protein epsilon
MVEFLEKAIELKGDQDFTIDERNLLSVGFKNLIGSQRGAIRTIGAIEQNPKYSKFGEGLGVYKKKIEKELYEQCIRIVTIVKD